MQFFDGCSRMLSSFGYHFNPTGRVIRICWLKNAWATVTRLSTVCMYIPLGCHWQGWAKRLVQIHLWFFHGISSDSACTATCRIALWALVVGRFGGYTWEPGIKFKGDTYQTPVLSIEYTWAMRSKIPFGIIAWMVLILDGVFMVMLTIWSDWISCFYHMLNYTVL